ncbi:hypothetical protein [Pseudomonas sp. ATCC PTA-122608]|uniref:hypothetical protein n=1 Tax=Pseudomonas sp. ATCC PTA-122608 TaxID=1771311 RepID=UPI00117B2C25|nr:hypothetical protein [Pseudomonas sp. ATCC PTA-122608]
MSKVKKVVSGGNPVFKQDGKWKDTVGGSHNSEAHAEFSLQKEIQDREFEGVNTLTKVDGFGLLIWFCLEVFLVGMGLMWFKGGSVMTGLGFILPAVFVLILGYKFFFTTMPRFREKAYTISALVLIAIFCLLKYFDILKPFGVKL